MEDLKEWFRACQLRCLRCLRPERSISSKSLKLGNSTYSQASSCRALHCIRAMPSSKPEPVAVVHALAMHSKGRTITTLREAIDLLAEAAETSRAELPISLSLLNFTRTSHATQYSRCKGTATLFR